MQSRGNKRNRGLRGFTLVELLVVIGIIAVLISILLPTLSRARSAAKTVQCLSNLRQFGNAQAMYAGQWKGWAIPSILGNDNTTNNRTTWINNPDFRKALSVKVWQPPQNGVAGNGQKNRFPLGMACPEAAKSEMTSNKNGATLQHSYGYNFTNMYKLPETATGKNIEFRSIKLTRVQGAAQKLMFADAMALNIDRKHSNHYMLVPGFDEARDTTAYPDLNAYVAYRHAKDKKSGNAQINVVFWDGHAETMKRSDVIAIKDPNGGTGKANQTKAWNNLWNLTAP
jgi:prepilin-type N-terminal cleavage/methylation domain-containing protein/prepilin-type processing-associated H-X9-DG protein